MPQLKKLPLFVTVLFMLCSLSAFGQIEHISINPPASNIIVPQLRSRAFIPERRGEIEITGIKALIDILESTATTTIEIQLHNNSRSRQEAELIFPVPDGAVVRGFAYDGPGQMVTAQVLPRDEAKRIYQQLVAKIRDPALVEFIGYNLIQSSVFPIEAGSNQKVRLTYEHLLETDGSRVDYFLPRTESLDYKVPWEIEVRIESSRPIATVYSPTHKLSGSVTLDLQSMNSANEPIVVKAETQNGIAQPGPFRLSYLLQENGMTASMFAYPDEKVGGGYFLLLAGLPVEALNADDTPAIKREVTLVIDRSGSMAGEKIQQVKEAAMQIVAGLKNGEAFNVLLYSNTVERFSNRPVIKSAETEKAARAYIEGVTATGGTNIYDALTAALEQEPSENMLPIVLFLTDGLPTVGQTSEIAIREVVIKSNPYNRRVFTFGVGFDVNAPLLEKIADESKAKAEFVLPDEDVEVKVGQVFERLTGPVLANPEIEVLQANGSQAIGRVRDILPDKLPDFFKGDQLILLGQYVGKEPITFEISGNYLGAERSFKFTFNFDKENIRNGFVPRLWASRKIAELIDEVRQAGADSAVSTDDPKIKELTDEIVRLSTEFGILTEYTAFLAREGTDLARRTDVLREVEIQLENRAMRDRSGRGAVNQSFNMKMQKSQETLNYSNSFIDSNMDLVSIANIQQINDKAYYRKGNRWVDSKLVEQESESRPDEIIEFGSDEYFELAERLANENRQGSIAFADDVLLMVDGRSVLIRNSF